MGLLRKGTDYLIAFVRRQKHNYGVGVARASGSAFLMGLTNQYSSIYAVGLGADAVQLGSLSSIGSAVSALFSVPVGWLVDRWGAKVFTLIAIALSAGGILVYALAHDWRLLILATVLASLSTRLTGTGSNVICADAVENRDRATAQGLCGTLSALAAVLAPLLAAGLITRFGGLTVEGIRPLFYLRLAGAGLVFLFVLLKLREPRAGRVDRARHVTFMADLTQLFQGNPMLRRWIIISVLMALPMPMF